jgi:hypothetical protein
MNKKNELAVMPTQEAAERMNEIVLSVTGAEGLNGFRKAYLMAEGIKKLKELLTQEYMAPIMELQGSKLGFRTDKDLVKNNGAWVKGPGYPMEVVKDCLIEAVLNGLQPTGNQFNIIAGNMYPTKEGTGFILNNYAGLKYSIVIGLPRISNDRASAAVEATIKWTLNGDQNEQIVPIPIKMDAYTSVDSVIGKATRKARAWLISRITGSEITDGEVEDTAHTVVSSTNTKKEAGPSNEEVERDRWLALIKDCTKKEELEFYLQSLPDDMKADYDKRMNEITGAK